MENIALVIEKKSKQVVYVTSNSSIIPKTQELDRYMTDPHYQVIVSIQTASAGTVRKAGEGGHIVEVPLSSLDSSIYRTDLGWTMDLFTPGAKQPKQRASIGGVQLTPRAHRPARLELTADAPNISHHNDTHAIAADGRSTTTLFISKKSADGKPMTEESDNDLVLLHTTRGTLSDRRVQLKRGQAQVSLRSSTDSIIADVTASGENLKRYMLHVEFVPPTTRLASTGALVPDTPSTQDKPVPPPKPKGRGKS